MADENSPVGDRLEAASTYFVALGGKMHSMAEQVGQLEEEGESARRELFEAELDRNAATARAQELEDDLNDMRLGLLTPDELIERHCSYVHAV